MSADESLRVPDLLLVRDGGPHLALTFDAGSTADGTAQLLALFRRLHLRPTLFVTGAFIRNHPALVRQAVLDGHEIGNHLLTHPHLTTYAKNRRQQLLPNVTRPWFEHQLLETERLFFEATGRRMAPLWRAPYGEENPTLRSWAYDLGYLHVRWSTLRGTSLDSRDWVADEHSSLYENPERMMKRLLSFPHLEGGIVLMHLSTHRSDPPWEVLPKLVAKLKARGIQLGSVTSLLEASPSWRPVLERARRRFDARQERAAAAGSSAAAARE
ncbi:MAG: polysaccharide deacetylase family protein [Acidobacteria bacterium]|nr:polysaccharide deacetylase family protein [Acidobacteriota bacterium]